MLNLEAEVKRKSGSKETKKKTKTKKIISLITLLNRRTFHGLFFIFVLILAVAMD